MTAAKRVLRYLKYSQDLGLVFLGTERIEVPDAGTARERHEHPGHDGQPHGRADRG